MESWQTGNRRAMAPAPTNSLQRFSDRVADYVRYRPSYPGTLLDYLAAHAGLGAGLPVADIGSGTGIFTRLLLNAGAKVFAVEPNQAMRGAAESELAGRAGFSSVDGTAEKTNLPPASVSLITCAQAFHWFDPARTRAEFMRILVPAGWCALIWNTSIVKGDAFAEGYEAIKSGFGTDFHQIRHENIHVAERFGAFFGNQDWEKRVFENFQDLDWEGLKGRLLSSSYAPKEGLPGHAPMMAELQSLFNRCQKQGSVRMSYATELFLGQFAIA
jgi:SAM-dependent methyltransferase